MEKKQKSSSSNSIEGMTFEKALASLEVIAQKLEKGELGLEESIEAFEDGMKYAKYCHEKLDEAERKIEILQKGGEIAHNKSVKKQIRVKKDTGEIDDDEDIQGSLL